jgi:hypothetical protein
MSLRAPIALIAAFAALTTLATGPAAAEELPAPKLFARWVQANGQVKRQFRSVRSHWIWDEQHQPVLRVELEFDLTSGWEITDAKGKSAKLKQAVRIWGGARGMQAWRVTVDQTGQSASLDLSLKVSDRVTDIASLLLLMPTRAQPYVIQAPACADQDLKLQPVAKQEGRFLFMALECIPEEDTLHFRVIRSTDAQWSSPVRTGETLDYKIPRPSSSKVYQTRLASLETQDSDGKESDFAVQFTPRKKPRRWDLMAGLSGTYFKYVESGQNIDLKQLALTARAGGDYRLIPKVLNAELNVFGTVVSELLTSSSLPTARFFGVDGRLGYRLPIGLGATQWFFLAGWYWWSMAVPDDSYGVSSLYGPQVFIQLRQEAMGHHPYQVYVKAATIGDGANVFEVGNRELAGGASFGVFSDPESIMIGVDVANTQFSKGLNSLSLLNVSLGVSKQF